MSQRKIRVKYSRLAKEQAMNQHLTYTDTIKHQGHFFSGRVNEAVSWILNTVEKPGTLLHLICFLIN